MGDLLDLFLLLLFLFFLLIDFLNLAFLSFLLVLLILIIRYLLLCGLLSPEGDGIADELRVLLDQVLEATLLKVLKLKKSNRSDKISQQELWTTYSVIIFN